VPVRCELADIVKRQPSIRLKRPRLIIEYANVGFVEDNIINLTRYDPPALSEMIFDRHSDSGLGQALLAGTSKHLAGKGCKSAFYCRFPFTR